MYTYEKPFDDFPVLLLYDGKDNLYWPKVKIIPSPFYSIVNTSYVIM